MAKDTALKNKTEQDYIIPAADIYENENEFILKLEMPGVGKDNVEITLENDYLEILGKVEHEKENDYKVIDREYLVGDYYRRFYVSTKIDRDKINAKMENGILTLTLAKSEEIKPRKIEVKTG